MSKTNEEKVKNLSNVVNKITKQKVQSITKKMLGELKNKNPKDIRVSWNLEEKFNYTNREKEELKQHIDNNYFKDYGAKSDRNALVNAETVRDLCDMIYNDFIPEANKA